MTDAQPDLNEDAFTLRLLNEQEAQGWMPPEMAQSTPTPDDNMPSEDQILALVEQARQEGYSLGREEGRKSFDEEIARLQQMLNAFAAPLNDIDEHVEHQLGALALSIGKQLCRAELSLNPTHILPIVHDGLEQLSGQREPVTLRLNPKDCQLLAEEGIAGTGVILLEDPSITTGGCVMTAGSSRIDERLESRLGKLVDQLFDEHALHSDGISPPDKGDESL
ncbi:FliH/SctL family protein [Litorivivens sp.]|uniref:FliH/SctL family protein n=1 Tax=Litorivivens sp. TaxID=2020868 RepID=UPI0035642978